MEITIHYCKVDIDASVICSTYHAMDITLLQYFQQLIGLHL